MTKIIATAISKKRFGLLLGSYLLLVSSAIVSAQVTGVTASVTPNGTNQNGQYTVGFTIANGAAGELLANSSTITITFLPSTILPASINASLVTVNGVASANVTVADSELTIVTPTGFKGPSTPTANISIVISSTAGIQNAGTAGTYNVKVRTSTQTAKSAPATYSIITTTSQVTAASVTPNPSVQSLNAAYTIVFSVGSGGYLTTNSTITLTFPSNSTVPQGSISGVTLNGATATTDGNSTSKVVTITSPVSISNNGSVTIVFLIGSGLKNPSTTGSKTITVRTSSETTNVTSTAFSISSNTALSVSAISLANSGVNQFSAYTLDFVTSATGALTANDDSLIVTFSGTTVIPSSISNSNVTVSAGGFSDIASGITVSGKRVSVRTPINIAAKTSVTLQFLSGANFQNPAVDSNYTLTLKTVHAGGATIDAEVTSNPYSVTAATSTITTPTVSLSNTAASATNVTYTFSFSTGSQGRLVAGTSNIKVIFPSGTGYQASPTATVNGVSSASVTRSTDTITVVVPSDISNSTSISLVITGINNPAAAGTKTATLKTSVERSNVSSGTYTIGGTSLVVNSVTVYDPGVNKVSADSILCSSVTNLDNGHTITVVFPEGTTVPSTITTADIALYGTQTISSVTANSSSRTVTIGVGQNNRNFTAIVFKASAGITNPSVPSTTYYKVTVSTTTNAQPAQSPAYTIRSNNSRVTSVTATATPNVISSAAAYQILFTPTAFGKLVSGTSAGSDSITVWFTTGNVNVPSSITASTVSINGTSCTGVRVVTSGNNGTVKLQVPNGVTLSASTQATIAFGQSSGLTNGSTAGSYQVRISTDADSAISTDTGNLTFANNASMSVTQASTSPSTVNAPSSFTVKFTTGSANSDTLAVGDSIKITFPTNTFVNSTGLSRTNYTVNGVVLNNAPTVIGGGYTLAIKSPVIITKLTTVTVAISSAAGILNPTIVGSGYYVNVSTHQLASSGGGTAGPFASPQYSTTATSTTVSTSTVTLSAYTPGTTGVTYTITFNVGIYGRLYPDSSKINITFPTGTTFGSLADSVNGVYGGVPTVSGQTVTVKVPSTVNISNNGAVTVKILGVTNPLTSGSKTLGVSTTVETSSVSSSSYSISNVAGVTSVFAAINSENGLPTDTVNMAGADSISFVTDAGAGGLTAGSSTVTITFPSNTSVPASITASTVRINGTAASSVTTNSGTREVTITVPSTIAGGSTVGVAFSTSSGVVNPTVAGTYNLSVRTSAQPISSTTASPYTVKATTTTIRSLTLTISPGDTSQLARYTYKFVTGLRGALLAGQSTISLLFPNDVAFTSGVPALNAVTVNGVAANALTLKSRIGTGSDTLIVTVPSSVTIVNNDTVNLIVDSTANIRNASLLTLLSYSVYTSVETGSVSSDFTLPVELAYFKVAQQNNRVLINWRTESEIDNAYWIVEKAEVPAELAEENPSAYKSLLTYSRIEALEGQGTKTSATDYIYQDEAVVPGKTYAYRLADVSMSGEITYHEMKVVALTAPREFRLYKNYPNPFNPTTTIRFDLPYDAKVTIKIYNILGQEVRELVNKNFSAGFQTVVWDTKNDRNVSVASGVYIYRIVAESKVNGVKYVKSDKMTFMK